MYILTDKQLLVHSRTLQMRRRDGWNKTFVGNLDSVTGTD